MQTADSIIFYPLSLRALDMVNVCLFTGQEIVNTSLRSKVWTYDPDLTDTVFGVEGKSSDGSRESLVEGIALNEDAGGSQLNEVMGMSRLIDVRSYYDSWK